MDERMTDERLKRLEEDVALQNTLKSYLLKGQAKITPSISWELLQALKAERAEVERQKLENRNLLGISQNPRDAARIRELESYGHQMQEELQRAQDYADLLRGQCDALQMKLRAFDNVREYFQEAFRELAKLEESE